MCSVGGSFANGRHNQKKSFLVFVVVTVECDKGIEEHFERSLGKDYPKCIAKGKNSSSIGGSTEPVLSALDHVPARRNGAVQTSPTNDVVSEGNRGNSAVSGNGLKKHCL